MHDFRHCLCMLCIFDAIFGFFVGVVLIVSFQPPALAGVLKGPIIMFLYHYLGYKFCKVLACVTFFAIAEILYFQNVAMRIRYLTINPSKKCYEWYSSVYGLTFVYTSSFTGCGIVGVAIYLLMYDEQDIPSVVASYPNYTTIFVDYRPGENIVMAADPKSPIWYFIFVYVSIATLYCEGNSYASFFMARRLLKKHASSFSKQTYDLQKQFLYLLGIQVSIPLLFIAYPILQLVMQTTFDWPMTKLQSEISTVWMALYSNINVSLTIMMISPYRRFTKRITVDVVLKLLKIKTQVTPIMEVQATDSLNFNSRVF